LIAVKALGATLFVSNSSDGTSCKALAGDLDAVDEMHRRFLNEQVSRRMEILLLVNTTGNILSGSGPSSSHGHIFDPQNLVTTYHDRFRSTGKQVNGKKSQNPA
jgi:hypothetical protein